MVRRLVASGYPVTGYDIRDEAVTTARQAGTGSAESPAAVAAGTDAVITMLPDGGAVSRAAYGPQGFIAALRPGQLLLEMTSSHPKVTRHIAADLVPRGIRVLDAPVSGGVRSAEEGTLCVMVGGPADVLDTCRPILECFGQIVHVGDRPGDGDTAKTINNLLSATTLWSALEVVTLGVKAGLSPERLLDAVNCSTGRSYTTEVKFPRYMLPRRFAAGFTVGQYLKDLDICLDVADDLGAPMLLGALVRQAWAIAAREGFADADHTALITLVERWMGVA
jgi:3-hydroxyisobutyrate dehydrogenase-like beta-hydroxyacid dehydrogenase